MCLLVEFLIISFLLDDDDGTNQLNLTSTLRDQMGWIEVNEKQFQNFLLKCDSKSGQPIVWSKVRNKKKGMEGYLNNSI